MALIVKHWGVLVSLKNGIYFYAKKKKFHTFALTQPWLQQRRLLSFSLKK